MIFSSLIFLYIFLPLNIIFYFIFKNTIYRNLILIAFSFLFYAWGTPVWAGILLFTATADYFHARLIQASRTPAFRRLFLFSSITINLGVLVLFKYAGFMVENFNNVFNTNLTLLKLVLPLGISFYIFRSISYIIDVYRADIAAEKYYHNYLMYLSLYPCLSAGPIVRYSEIASEVGSRKSSAHDISEGVTRFCIGLFKKIYFANFAAELSGQFLNADLAQSSVAACWLGIILFSLQIYFDFSGYSDMAIGLGRIFGFHFKENFNFPYISKSVTEFWRRWHISLSSWLRDYIFLPFSMVLAHRLHKAQYLFLKSKHWVNIFALTLTFFVCGLWHGASWNFVLWGLYFAFFMILESLFLSKILNYKYNFLSNIYFLAVIIVGWALFYFSDLNKFADFFMILFGQTPNPATDLTTKIQITNNIYWLLLAFIFCLPVKQSFIKLFKKRDISETPVFILSETAVNIFLLFISTSLMVGMTYRPFLYFQF